MNPQSYVILATAFTMAVIVAVGISRVVRQLWSSDLLEGLDRSTHPRPAETRDAHRMARMVVGLLKLSNEEQIRAGREHRDLKRRLHDEIERARETWREAVGPQPEGDTVFESTLVEILAGGDPRALGGEVPEDRSAEALEPS